MDPFAEWVAALEARHLARFEFAEVRKALQALSSVYVERRDRLGRGAALDTEGKRAAFALFYAPLHFLFVRRVLEELGGGPPPLQRVVDLGCGTAPAGTAWATLAGPGCRVEGYERHGWAAEEARRTLSAFRLSGRIHTGDLLRAALPGAGSGIVAAYTVNELDEAARERLLAEMLRAAQRGARVLVVEPMSRRAAPYWPGWEKAFKEAGGRGDEWRFAIPLPDLLKRFDRAAGLDHRELIGRTLWLAGATSPRP
jgi:SAM-dependent methyltransferase